MMMASGRQRICFLIYLPLCIMALIGCTSPVSHPWRVEGGFRGIILPTQNWPALPSEDYCLVDASAREKAVKMLNEKSCLRIGEADVQAYCQKFHRKNTDEKQPYLVRGVIFGDCPWNTVVRFNRQRRQLQVHNATYNGENLFLDMAVRHAIPHPLVVYLPEEPLDIYPTAVVGGDGVR